MFIKRKKAIEIEEEAVRQVVVRVVDLHLGREKDLGKIRNEDDNKHNSNLNIKK